MEIVYGFIGLLVLVGLWFFCGWLVMSSANFMSMYLTGDRFFSKEDPFHPAVAFGPMMFVWLLYPLWLLLQYIYTALHNNIDRTVVVVENIREYAYDYRHKCLSKASTKSLSNFFNAYMEKETSKFCHTETGDKNALENFFRVDGWRNVGDGVWTKIVKVSELK